jgi:hypothetical protein
MAQLLHFCYEFFDLVCAESHIAQHPAKFNRLPARLHQRGATGSANAMKFRPAVVTTHCRPSSM